MIDDKRQGVAMSGQRIPYARKMKWPKRLLVAFAALLAIAVALPFFISLNDYIPRI